MSLKNFWSLKGRVCRVANKNSQIQGGAILAYILIFLNATYGLFLTPYIIGQIGTASYGVYKTVSAFTSSLMVLDLGLGGTMMRYISKYRTEKEEHKIPNFIAMGIVQASVMCCVVGVVSFVLYFFLDEIYSGGLTARELVEAKTLYIVLSLCLLTHIFENLLNGIISGYNRFVFANGIKVTRLLARIALVVVFLGVFKSSFALVLVDLVVTLGFVLSEVLYLLFNIRAKVKLIQWDRAVFSESFVYTILMFLTFIVAQANTNFSNIIIGSLISSVAVAVYSMALLIFGIYEQLSTAISGVVLPTVTEVLKHDDGKYTNTTKLVIKAGRIQFLLLGAALAGFLVLGRQFIDMWLGGGYEDVYYITLILIGPALFELCINVCLSILRAKNMLGFRTIVIAISAFINLMVSLLLVRKFGYYVCAISSSLCYFTSSVVVMGIYYYKKFKINLLVLYKKIFSKIWLCIVFSSVAAVGAVCIFSGTVHEFVGGFVAFVVTYGATLLAFGLDKNEKDILYSKIRRNKND